MLSAPGWHDSRTHTDPTNIKKVTECCIHDIHGLATPQHSLCVGLYDRVLVHQIKMVEVAGLILL